MSTNKTRVAIIGAGPAGLATARALKEAGVDPVIYDRHSDVGGIWDIDAPGSPMYESAHFISSKTHSAFGDFPMPESYADYPRHDRVLEYIRSYADHFGLRSLLRPNAEVTQIDRLATGAWQVHASDGTNDQYDAIVCANGVTWIPNIPSLPGTFAGEQRHSSTYRSPSEFAGKRVLVVGVGNSGADIACDAARAAASATLSMRRGYWFVPKHAFGKPFDEFAMTGFETPEWVGQIPSAEALLESLVGDVQRLGFPKPDHAAFSSHPVMNTQIVHHAAHGDVQIAADVARLEGSTVHFVDGTSGEFDMILWATGYHQHIPFIDQSLVDWKGNRPDAYLNVFPRRTEGLYLNGFIELAGGVYELFEHIGRLIALDITSEAAHTELAQLRLNDTTDLKGGTAYVDSDRHANYLDVFTYSLHLHGLLEKLSSLAVTK